MDDSILTSVKKTLGLAESYDVFDLDVIMHINTVFSTLNQLGIGPSGGFQIMDAVPTWDTFLRGNPNLNSVKSYIFLRVRLLFDPPATSFAIAAMQDQIRELEWRLNLTHEYQSNELLGGHKRVTGNAGDVHNITLRNPAGQNLINAAGTYSAEFVPDAPRATRTDYFMMIEDLISHQQVAIDETRKADGILVVTATIANGTYIIRRDNPRRTIMKLEVRAE